MSPQMVELALRKQRLQIRAEAQRDDMMGRLAGIESALDTVDRVRDQLDWAKEKAPLLTGAALLLLMARPRRTWWLVRRAWVGWMLLSRVRGGSVAPLVPVLLSLFSRWRASRAARG
ncbi:hypothetical protein GPA19_16000 [Azoarcus indigens]|nr:YqjK family protein [Azoarcus indigens]NMG66448.1 hypothetical protein [Azoarcus indigens]